MSALEEKYMDKPMAYQPPRFALYGLALVGAALGLSYLPWLQPAASQMPYGIRLLTAGGHIPIIFFCVLWLFSAVLTLIAAVRRRPGWAGVGGIVAMCTLFGSFYMVGWIVEWINTGVPTRIYILGACLLGLAIYVGGNVPPDPPEVDHDHHPLPPYYVEESE